MNDADIIVFDLASKRLVREYRSIMRRGPIKRGNPLIRRRLAEIQMERNA